MVFGGGVVGGEGPYYSNCRIGVQDHQSNAAILVAKDLKAQYDQRPALLPDWRLRSTPRWVGWCLQWKKLPVHISVILRPALFTAVIIAGLTAQGLLGPYLYLGYPDVSNLSGYIFFGVIAVGIVTGVLGSGMAGVILSVMKWVRSLKISKRVIYITVCALLLASMAYFISERALGSGKEIMTHALFTADKHLPWYMPVVRIRRAHYFIYQWCGRWRICARR